MAEPLLKLLKEITYTRQTVIAQKLCRFIIMDLSEVYHKIARDYFPKAMIVADRFHVVRLANHHFLKTWTQLDEIARKNRGLLHLMRMHEWSNMKERSRRKFKSLFIRKPN